MVDRRQERSGSEWTADRLRTLLRTRYAGESIVVLANRQPFRHDRAPDGEIVVKRSAGGLVTALEPVLEACAGVWVAHGAGTADRCVVDARQGLDVPPASPTYRLRRVWLEPHEERHYYYGFANEGLWPLCHRARVRPVFRSVDFRTYRAVNARFADAVCEEVKTDRPLVLVQDYHLALAPRMIRERLPLATIIAFWHIPWPSPRGYAACPWGTDLLDGLLGASLIGFQTPEDCDNFVESAREALDARVNEARDAISRAGHCTTIRAYPVSIESPNRWASQSPSIDVCRSIVRRQLHLPEEVLLGVGVDRLDYTKGLVEKFLTIERLLDSHPEFRGRFVFVQIAEPSRTCLPAYRDLRSRIIAIADRVNARFGADDYRPVVLLDVRHEPADVYRFLRAADVCYVGSLHDGMNLVAKEFVSARDDDRGVLVLSAFAGAARELTSALIVNPHAIDRSSETLARALTMSDDEQRRRMRRMRAVVARRNTFAWAGEMLTDAIRWRSADAADERRRTVDQPVAAIA